MAASAPKRSLFKRPAWASTAPTKAPDEDHEFYRHTTTVADIVAEKAQKRDAARRQRKLEETKAEEQRRMREENGAKRRKVERDEAGLGEPRSRNEGSAERAVEGEEAIIPAMDGKQPHGVRQQSEQEKTNVVDIGSEDDEGANGHPAPTDPGNDPVEVVGAQKRPRSEKKSEYSDDSSDNDSDYTREIKRRAREKERRQKLSHDPIKSASPVDAAPAPSLHRSIGSPSTSFYHELPARPDSVAWKTRSPPPVAPEDEPIVEILIRSPIPNTRPLVVRRRESQPLKEVRLAWCAKQLFNEEFTGKVYFTWRGARVYDVTTCRNFALQAQKERKEKNLLGDDDWYEDDGRRKRDSEGETLKIELEAVTAEILQEIQRKREQEARMTDAEEVAEDEEEPPPEQPKEKKIGVILKGKGLKDVRLKVAPGHLVGKIMQAFRQQANVPQEKSVYLLFDGERLEADLSVEDAGLEDGDCVDVQVR